MGIYGHRFDSLIEHNEIVNEGFINAALGKKKYKENKEFVDDCINKVSEAINKKKYCKKFNSPNFSYDWYNKKSIEFRVYIGSISILKLYEDVYKEDASKAVEKGVKTPKLKEELEKLEKELNSLLEDSRVRVLIDYMYPENYFYHMDETDKYNLYDSIKDNPFRDVHDLNVCPDIDLIFTFAK